MKSLELEDINVTERLEQLMARRNVNLTKDVRFKRLHTTKWFQFAAEPKSKLLDGFYL